MAKKKYKIQHLEIAAIKEEQIPADVLDRIDGYEILVGNMANGLDTDDGIANTVYAVSKLKKIATKSKENDTNETTRIRVAELWEAVYNYKYLMIIQ